MLPRQFYSLRQKINERMPHGPAVSTVYMLHEVYADGETPADAVCAVSLSRFTAWLDRLPADLRAPWFLPRKNINDAALWRKGV